MMLKKQGISIICKSNSLGVSKIYLVALFILYRLTLDLVYKFCVTPFYDYSNMVYEYNAVSYIFSLLWMIIIILYDLILFEDDRPSSNLLLFTDLLFFIPLTSISGLANFNSAFILYAFFFWSIMAIIQIRTIKKKKTKEPIIDNLRFSKAFYVITWTIILLNAIITIYYNGFHLKFDLNDIYDIREEMGEMELPGIVGYIKPLASKITLILLAINLFRKRYIESVSLVILQLVNYSFGAMKSDFLYIFIIIILVYFYKPKYKHWIIVSLLLLNICSLVELRLIGFSAISALLQRRILFIPSLLSSEYFTYFSENELAFFRDSFLRWFRFDNPYPQHIPNLIGEVFHDNPDQHANTGILGDDFAQLGWLSLLLFPLLRVKLLHICIDSANEFYTKPIMLYISFILGLGFISSSFFSTLLTGGFIALAILLYIGRCRFVKKSTRAV